MQRKNEGKDDIFESSNPFGSFGNFGSHRSMISNLFGERDPFDDPFFTRPSNSMFQSSMFGPGGPSSVIPTTNKAKGPVIEELHSDDESEERKEDKNSGDEKVKPSGSSKEPSVEHPDDDDDERAGMCVNARSDHNRVEGRQPQAQSYSYRKVTCGGINGAYYTSSQTRRTGSDGVTLEESRAADTTTGQATHRISKGIHDKGHSVTRKLKSDGKVDTMQTLHNLNEDELAGFEEIWKGNADKHLPGWIEGVNLRGSAGSSGHDRQPVLGGWALPPTGRSVNAGRTGTDYGARANNSSGGRAKKVVTIPIE